MIKYFLLGFALLITGIVKSQTIGLGFKNLYIYTNNNSVLNYTTEIEPRYNYRVLILTPTLDFLTNNPKNKWQKRIRLSHYSSHTRRDRNYIYSDYYVDEIMTQKAEFSTLSFGLLQSFNIKKLIFYYGLEVIIEYRWQNNQENEGYAYNFSNELVTYAVSQTDYGKSYACGLLSTFAPYYQINRFQIGFDFNIGLRYQIDFGTTSTTQVAEDYQNNETNSFSANTKNRDTVLSLTNYFSIGIRYSLLKNKAKEK